MTVFAGDRRGAELDFDFPFEHELKEEIISGGLGGLKRNSAIPDSVLIRKRRRLELALELVSDITRKLDTSDVIRVRRRAHRRNRGDRKIRHLPGANRISRSGSERHSVLEELGVPVHSTAS